MNYSPVLITVYNRYEHFVRCINSLKACTGASNTILYIALDYPTSSHGKDIYYKILEFTNQVVGFKEVVCFNRLENFGAEKNFFTAIDAVFNEHTTVILSEDDNVFSENFLEYINKGLALFQKDDSVFSISGYNYPIISDQFVNPDSFYRWTGFSGWGVGVWRNKYHKVDMSINYVRKFLRVKGNRKLLYRFADHYFPGAVDMLYNNYIAGDTIFSIYQAEHQMKTIFPGISKVRTYGHDGSGVHASHTNEELFSNQTIDNRHNFDFNIKNEVTSSTIDILLKKNFKRSWKSKLYHWLRMFWKVNISVVIVLLNFY